jgi:hypothetical protein
MSNPPSQAAKPDSVAKKAYDIFKKFLDPLDDILAAIRAALLKTKGLLSKAMEAILDTVTYILIGCIGFILHGVELFEAGKSLYKQFQDYRKTKTVPELLDLLFPSYNLLLAGTGLGLSAALIAGVAGAAVSALVFLVAPVIIPALLLFIYVNKFIKNCTELYKEKIRNDDLPVSEEQAATLHEKKCEVAFSFTECVASSLVVAGIASGLFPLTIAGVCLGAASKVFEKIDEKYDHRLTLSIKSFFISLGRKMGFEKYIPHDPRLQSDTDIKMRPLIIRKAPVSSFQKIGPDKSLEETKPKNTIPTRHLLSNHSLFKAITSDQELSNVLDFKISSSP